MAFLLEAWSPGEVSSSILGFLTQNITHHFDTLYQMEIFSSSNLGKLVNWQQKLFFLLKNQNLGLYFVWGANNEGSNHLYLKHIKSLGYS